jgi:hypothetical protein
MSLGRKLALAAAAAALAPAASAQQKVTGPIATYWMSAQTQTGFGMPAGGGGDPQAMMRAMMGGGGANKSLLLQLGSTQGNPQPAADPRCRFEPRARIWSPPPPRARRRPCRRNSRSRGAGC